MVNRRTMEFFARSYPKDYPEPESVTILLKKGFAVEEIPVMMKERDGGKSSISFLKSIRYMVQVTLAVIAAAFHN